MEQQATMALKWYVEIGTEEVCDCPLRPSLTGQKQANGGFWIISHSAPEEVRFSSSA